MVFIDHFYLNWIKLINDMDVISRYSAAPVVHTYNMIEAIILLESFCVSQFWYLYEILGDGAFTDEDFRQY